MTKKTTQFVRWYNETNQYRPTQVIKFRRTVYYLFGCPIFRWTKAVEYIPVWKWAANTFLGGY